ncbi:hypothetical protein CBL_07309 [Carabus blaptoides fortunei]
MRISLLFFFVLFALAAMFGQGEARWKFGKKLEKIGKNVFNAANKALPVVTGYKNLGRR